ncbi:MAG: hypothetical protein CMN78_04710 [Spirochaetales bacterium]|nr:hypothetical protein [Spirochaetales bacterium]
MKEESREPGKPIYHYKREDRTSSLPERVRGREKRGIFRGNRSLLITTLDLVFLAILVVVFLVLMRAKGDTTILPGFAISAQATEYGNLILVSVKTKNEQDETTDSRHVRIVLGFPEGTERVELDGFLPDTSGVEAIFRGSLPAGTNNRRVRIDVYSGEYSGTLHARIKGE